MAVAGFICLFIGYYIAITTSLSSFGAGAVLVAVVLVMAERIFFYSRKHCGAPKFCAGIRNFIIKPRILLLFRYVVLHETKCSWTCKYLHSEHRRTLMISLRCALNSGLDDIIEQALSGG